MAGSEAVRDQERTALIYVGYAQVMRKFQLLEMQMWCVLVRGIKPATTLAQAIGRLSGWDGTGMGKLWNGSLRNQTHWPAGLVPVIDEVIEERNYLAHHFLREYFVAERSDENADVATSYLIELDSRLESLMEQIDAHLVSLGQITAEQYSELIQKDLETLRLKRWARSSAE